MVSSHSFPSQHGCRGHAGSAHTPTCFPEESGPPNKAAPVMVSGWPSRGPIRAKARGPTIAPARIPSPTPRTPPARGTTRSRSPPMGARRWATERETIRSCPAPIPRAKPARARGAARTVSKGQALSFSCQSRALILIMPAAAIVPSNSPGYFRKNASTSAQGSVRTGNDPEDVDWRVHRQYQQIQGGFPLIPPPRALSAPF